VNAVELPPNGGKHYLLGQEEEGEEGEGGGVMEASDVIEPPFTYGGMELLEIKVLQYTATQCKTHCNTLHTATHWGMQHFEITVL